MAGAISMDKILWIRFLNDLFYGRSYIAAPAELSIPFLLDEKSTVVPVCLARRAVGRQAKGFLWRRSVELRASGAVGLRWQAAFGSSDQCVQAA
jgi:hypothetical protein